MKFKLYEEFLNESDDTEAIDKKTYDRDVCLVIYEQLLPTLIPLEKMLTVQKWSNHSYMKVNSATKAIATYLESKTADKIYGCVVLYDTEAFRLVFDHYYYRNPNMKANLVESTSLDINDIRNLGFWNLSLAQYTHWKVKDINYYIHAQGNDVEFLIFQEDIDKLKNLMESGEYRQVKNAKRYGLS